MPDEEDVSERCPHLRVVTLRVAVVTDRHPKAGDNHPRRYVHLHGACRDCRRRVERRIQLRAPFPPWHTTAEGDEMRSLR